MTILISVLLIVEVIAAFLLIVVILAQKSKDQGLGMAFGGGMGESLFGSRAGNVLTRMTVTLAVVFMVTTMLLGILFARSSAGTGSVMDRADLEVPAMPVAPTAAPQTAPAMVGDAAPIAMPSEPVALQMGETGELAPVAAEPAVSEVVSEAVAIPVSEEVAVEVPAATPVEEPREEAAPQN